MDTPVDNRSPERQHYKNWNSTYYSSDDEDNEMYHSNSYGLNSSMNNDVDESLETIPPSSKGLLVYSCFKWISISFNSHSNSDNNNNYNEGNSYGNSYDSSGNFPWHALIEFENNNNNKNVTTESSYFIKRVRNYTIDRLSIPTRRLPYYVHSIALLDAYQLLKLFVTWKNYYYDKKRINNQNDNKIKRFRQRKYFKLWLVYNYQQLLLQLHYNTVTKRYQKQLLHNYFYFNWLQLYRSISYHQHKQKLKLKEVLILLRRTHHSMNINKQLLVNSYRYYNKKLSLQCFNLWISKLNKLSFLSIKSAIINNIIKQNILTMVVTNYYNSSNFYYVLLSIRNHCSSVRKAIIQYLLSNKVIEKRYRDSYSHSESKNHENSTNHHNSNSYDDLELLAEQMLYNWYNSLSSTTTPTKLDIENKLQLMLPISTTTIVNNSTNYRNISNDNSYSNSAGSSFITPEKVVLSHLSPTIAGGSNSNNRHSHIDGDSYSSPNANDESKSMYYIFIKSKNLSSVATQQMLLGNSKIFCEYRHLLLSFKRWRCRIPQLQLDKASRIRYSNSYSKSNRTSHSRSYSDRHSRSQGNSDGIANNSIGMKVLLRFFIRKWFNYIQRRLFLVLNSKKLAKQAKINRKMEVFGIWLISAGKYEYMKRISNRIICNRFNKILWHAWFAWHSQYQRMTLLKSNQKQLLELKAKELSEFTMKMRERRKFRSQLDIMKMWSLIARDRKRGKLLISLWNNTAGKRELYNALHHWKLLLELDTIITCMKQCWRGYKVRFLTHNHIYSELQQFKSNYNKAVRYRLLRNKWIIVRILKKYLLKIYYERAESIKLIVYRRTYDKLRNYGKNNYLYQKQIRISSLLSTQSMKLKVIKTLRNYYIIHKNHSFWYHKFRYINYKRFFNGLIAAAKDNKYEKLSKKISRPLRLSVAWKKYQNYVGRRRINKNVLRACDYVMKRKILQFFQTLLSYRRYELHKIYLGTLLRKRVYLIKWWDKIYSDRYRYKYAINYYTKKLLLLGLKQLKRKCSIVGNNLDNKAKIAVELFQTRNLSKKVSIATLSGVLKSSYKLWWNRFCSHINNQKQRKYNNNKFMKMLKRRLLSKALHKLMNKAIMMAMRQRKGLSLKRPGNTKSLYSLVLRSKPNYSSYVNKFINTKTLKRSDNHNLLLRGLYIWLCHIKHYHKIKKCNKTIVINRINNKLLIAFQLLMHRSIRRNKYKKLIRNYKKKILFSKLSFYYYYLKRKWRRKLILRKRLTPLVIKYYKEPIQRFFVNCSRQRKWYQHNHRVIAIRKLLKLGKLFFNTLNSNMKKQIKLKSVVEQLKFKLNKKFYTFNKWRKVLELKNNRILMFDQLDRHYLNSMKYYKWKWWRYYITCRKKFHILIKRLYLKPILRIWYYNTATHVKNSFIMNSITNKIDNRIKKEVFIYWKIYTSKQIRLNYQYKLVRQKLLFIRKKQYLYQWIHAIDHHINSVKYHKVLTNHNKLLKQKIFNLWYKELLLLEISNWKKAKLYINNWKKSSKSFSIQHIAYNIGQHKFDMKIKYITLVNWYNRMKKFLFFYRRKLKTYHYYRHKKLTKALGLWLYRVYLRKRNKKVKSRKFNSCRKINLYRSLKIWKKFKITMKFKALLHYYHGWKKYSRVMRYRREASHNRLIAVNKDITVKLFFYKLLHNSTTVRIQKVVSEYHLMIVKNAHWKVWQQHCNYRNSYKKSLQLLIYMIYLGQVKHSFITWKIRSGCGNRLGISILIQKTFSNWKNIMKARWQYDYYLQRETFQSWKTVVFAHNNRRQSLMKKRHYVTQLTLRSMRIDWLLLSLAFRKWKVEDELSLTIRLHNHWRYHKQLPSMYAARKLSHPEESSGNGIFSESLKALFHHPLYEKEAKREEFRRKSSQNKRLSRLQRIQQSYLNKEIAESPAKESFHRGVTQTSETKSHRKNPVVLFPLHQRHESRINNRPGSSVNVNSDMKANSRAVATPIGISTPLLPGQRVMGGLSGSMIFRLGNYPQGPTTFSSPLLDHSFIEPTDVDKSFEMEELM